MPVEKGFDSYSLQYYCFYLLSILEKSQSPTKKPPASLLRAASKEDTDGNVLLYFTVRYK